MSNGSVGSRARRYIYIWVAYANDRNFSTWPVVLGVSGGGVYRRVGTGQFFPLVLATIGRYCYTCSMRPDWRIIFSFSCVFFARGVRCFFSFFFILICRDCVCFAEFRASSGIFEAWGATAPSPFHPSFVAHLFPVQYIFAPMVRAKMDVRCLWVERALRCFSGGCLLPPLLCGHVERA